PELAVESRAHAAELALLTDPRDRIDAEAGVADRQHPADRFDAPVAADLGIGNDAQSRQHRLAAAPEGAAVLELAHADGLHALVGLVPGDFGHDAHGLDELHAAERGVQDVDVERVGQVVVVLEPVAWNDGRAAAADAGVVGLEEFALLQLLQ